MQRNTRRMPHIHNLYECEYSKDAEADEKYELLVFANSQPKSAHGVKSLCGKCYSHSSD